METLVPAVTAVTGAASAEYAKEDLQIFDMELTSSEMAELAALRK